MNDLGLHLKRVGRVGSGENNLAVPYGERVIGFRLGEDPNGGLVSEFVVAVVGEVRHMGVVVWVVYRGRRWRRVTSEWGRRCVGVWVWAGAGAGARVAGVIDLRRWRKQGRGLIYAVEGGWWRWRVRVWAGTRVSGVIDLGRRRKRGRRVLFFFSPTIMVVVVVVAAVHLLWFSLRWSVWSKTSVYYHHICKARLKC